MSPVDELHALGQTLMKINMFIQKKNVLYVVFMSFLVMRVIFVMSELEISRFLTIWE